MILEITIFPSCATFDLLTFDLFVTLTFVVTLDLCLAVALAAMSVQFCLLSCQCGDPFPQLASIVVKVV